MYKIATLNKISPAGLNRLTERFPLTDRLPEASGILVRSHGMHDMDFPENLLAIARAGAGVNNIPLDRCSRAGIVVFNTPGANANAVKELVLASLFLSARNLRDALNWTCSLCGNVSSTVEKEKGQFAGNEIKGKTLGIIGLGAIGVAVANAAESLGMKVISYDPFITWQAAHELSNTVSIVKTLDELLPRCDYITLHVPAIEETKDMFSRKTFEKVKRGVTLLNFSRDSIVNDEDLIAALESGAVFRYITDFPNDALLNRKSVIAIPHLGASTEEAEENCASMAVEELMDYLENGNITHSVNYPDCNLGAFIPGKGQRICILNKNIPAILGTITGVLAEANINIRDLINKSKGDYACTLIDIDTDVDEAMLRQKLAIEGIILVRILK